MQTVFYVLASITMLFIGVTAFLQMINQIKAAKRYDKAKKELWNSISRVLEKLIDDLKKREEQR